MRNNIAISADASFHRQPLSWSKNDLPIALPWRSSLWRTIVPTLWVLGWAVWLWVADSETSGRSMAVHGMLFVAIPAMLAISAAWWVRQFVTRRNAGALVVNDDYLEWQFETGSNIELLSDCGPFRLAGKRWDARIEWDIMSSSDGAGAWSRLARKLSESDRVLYARDLGLDRGELDRLCKLLNQLRAEAGALSPRE
jgi:hypothetical protein